MALTPLQWLTDRLIPGLQTQWIACQKAHDYYEGNQPFEIASEKYRAEFARMLNSVCDNWMPLIVDAVEERLEVTGFRFNMDRENRDTSSDEEAWDIWQRNHLDNDSSLMFSTALTCGISYAMIWGDEKTNEPVITAEHPSQAYVITNPGNHRERLAGLKIWTDGWTDIKFANVFLPEGVWKFRQNAQNWELYQSLRNPLKLVPILPIVNRGNMFGQGKSELFEAFSTQDQINKLLKDMLVASEFAAYRQRWAVGVEVPRDENGNDINPFKTGVDRLLTVSDPEARFGEFSASDLNNYVGAIENRIQSLASRTRTPPHYLLGQSGQFPSGESLRAAETGLVAKVKRRRTPFSGTLEEMMRLAFLVKRDTARANAFRAETIWRDPETRTESEYVDSLVKLLAIGVPKRALWERYGFTDSEIDRFQGLLLDEALEQGLAQGGNSGGFPGAASPFELEFPEPTNSPSFI